mmetsp:Transcript_72521/g.216379  ORF Transcript_72521/g.216379 Transcript_72521/m.216379 type:complete len:1045 (-) Transcript_72521:159-3293(-)
MGAQTSQLDATAASTKPNEFARMVQEALDTDNFDKFSKLWSSIQKTREERHPEYDDLLCKEEVVLRSVKYALKRQDPPEWRRKGVEIARTFFHLDKARAMLAQMDFITYLLVTTLPDEQEEEENEDGKGAQDKEKAEKDKTIQLEAAETICELAKHDEFMKSLCCTSVLNFLCIVLNQVEEARDIVTEVFVRLSSTEDHDVLAMLIEDSVGDVLESFFKTVEFKTLDETERPDDSGDKKQWRRNVSALSNCAHTLGTLVKYRYQVHVHKRRIIEVFRYIVDFEGQKKNVRPHNMRLLAEMSRLFYWICRGSTNVTETLSEASDTLDQVLKVLKEVWEICPSGPASQHIVSMDVELSEAKLSDPNALKVYHAQMCLCHMNCLLWVLLPESTIRWKLKRLDLSRLHSAFGLRSTDLRRVVLSTVRYLLDLPPAQECSELIRFFGEQLLVLLDLAQRGTLCHARAAGDQGVITLLLDAVTILAMQRGMQEMMAEYDIWRLLQALLDRPGASGVNGAEARKHELLILLTNAQVAMHPEHRLDWASRAPDPAFEYPPRAEFKLQLNGLLENEAGINFRTVASILLAAFQERSLAEGRFTTLLEWWQEHTTALYEEGRVGGAGGARSESIGPLEELLRRAARRREERRALTCMETLRCCAPHECVLALSLFSRLALEPRFKKLLFEGALHALLGCVCVGIWPEAREAAATLANLMWLPDLQEERLVCWLKLDSPRCVAVDAANVLLPMREGSPRGADIGKGMYQSTWGVQFVEHSCVILHPDGLRTHEVPGILTAASPLSTFENTSRREYQWLDDAKPHPKHFTMTCWFYWPPDSSKGNKVLIQTSKEDRMSQVYLDFEKDPEGVWTLTTDKRTKKPLKTPRLNPGWHMLSLVSSTEENGLDPFSGTRFFLDTWQHDMKGIWVKNEFYMLGNDSGYSASKPFGLIADFRIYARTLSVEEISAMVHSRDTTSHPDQIVRRLAQMDAATILAQRLDVPDSAAECLRALGSLATLVTQRAKIYSICGRQVLKMLDSPLPMIHRQAVRLMNNIM